MVKAITMKEFNQMERIKQLYLAPGPRRTLDTEDFDWVATHRKLSPDMNWVTKRIACGGMVDTDKEMAMLAEQGVTHILNMSEWDDTSLAQKHGIESLWNYTDDDFEPKSHEFFDRGVRFAKRVLAKKGSKLLFHCAAGIHRAPMMTLAVLGSTGWNLKQAQRRIKKCRPCVGFPDVYVKSVRRYPREARRRRKATTGSAALKGQALPDAQEPGWSVAVEGR